MRALVASRRRPSCWSPRDRQRQRALGAFDGRGRIAHLLVENEERRAVFQFFSRCSHAAPEERQNSFEHWQLPCYEHCS